MDRVKHIVAVASGKGGVGKSTTAVNLALAAQALGQRVGLLDADIYGPSIGMMLGVDPAQRPAPAGDNRLAPVVAHGLQTMSMAYLVTEQTPMVWRGPMAAGALMQLLEQVAWPELDLLIVDMPPGTSDIQLTLSQKARLSGAVVVTTPQDIALLDARKAIEMFNKVSVPVLGVVENMAVHHCSACGHAEAIFGDSGGMAVAQQYGVPLLGQLPLDIALRSAGDSGAPLSVSSPEHPGVESYRAIAKQLIAALASSASEMPEIVIE